MSDEEIAIEFALDANMIQHYLFLRLNPEILEWSHLKSGAHFAVIRAVRLFALIDPRLYAEHVSIILPELKRIDWLWRHGHDCHAAVNRAKHYLNLFGLE